MVIHLDMFALTLSKSVGEIHESPVKAPSGRGLLQSNWGRMHLLLPSRFYRATFLLEAGFSFFRAIREDAIDFCSNRYSVPYAPTLLFKVRANMSKCITTPSSRVSPHLLAQRGHTRRAHINDRPLIMPLVAWWEKICAPSDWRTLFWCLALLFSPPFSPPLRLA